MFVYHRENRKKDARRWRHRLIIAGALAISVSCAFALYWWRAPVTTFGTSLMQRVIDNPYFSVREIQVRGGEKVDGSEIVLMAGLKHGMNLWRIDPLIIEQNIARIPWVRRVTVRREFPRRVVIDVEERTAKALVALGRLYYVDSEGIVFKEVGEQENVNLPLLTGLRPEEVTASSSATRRKIQDAIYLGELMGRDSHSLSEIRFDAGDRLVVYTTAYPIAFHMGQGEWAPKLQRLERVLAVWKGREERLAALDLSFRDQVVARLRKRKE